MPMLSRIGGAAPLGRHLSGLDVFIFLATISSSTTTPYNLKASAIAAGWDQVKPLWATVTINGGVNQQSNAIGTPAFDTGATFPAGTLLALINNGTITGYAGATGSGGSRGAGAPGGSNGYPGSSGGTGGTGGIALKAQAPISVTNGSGSLIGGSAGIGGGGGGGGTGSYLDPKMGWQAGASGGDGNTDAGWAGGGHGGSPGNAGEAGANSSTVGGSGGAAGSAGSQGNYINGNSNVTWVSNGTRTGSVV